MNAEPGPAAPLTAAVRAIVAAAIMAGVVGLPAGLTGAASVYAASTTLAAMDGTLGPADVVGGAVTRVREIVDAAAGQPAAAPNVARAARRARVQEIIDEIVDFREMSRRALGVQWTALSPGQQREFVDLFTRLVEQSYLGQIDMFFGQRVDYVGQTVDGDTAVVMLAVGAAPRSELAQEYGRPRRASDLSCSLHRAGGRWRIYDVSVDGIGLVSIYRSQFARVLQNESYPALVDRLRRKVDTAAATVTGP